MKIDCRTIALTMLLLLMISPRSSARCQSQKAPPAQAQSQSQAQPKPEAQPQPGSQVSLDSALKEESVADAARKAKAKKEKTEHGKVLTDDDLSGLRGNGVSVVGDGSSGRSASQDSSLALPEDGGATPSGAHDEQYWRAKARDLLDQIAATDQKIAKTEEEIKKYGNIGFDPQTGLKKNVIYVDDRPTQVKKLEQHKQDLQKKLEDLEDQGRKEGAPPAWFR
jgi:hypothetical protein